MVSAIRGFYAALLLLAIPLWGACIHESLPKPEEQLVGRWEWQRTASPDSPTLTPANTGHRVVVEFDRRGHARFYEDDAFMSATVFSVRNELQGIGQPARHVLMYRGYRGIQVYSVSGNSLQLREAKGKVLEHSYTRVRQ